MATRVELNVEAVRNALEQALASAKRGHNTTKNPEFKPIFERQIGDLQKALGTLTEVK